MRQREVQPSELVEAAIERIERLNPALNAVILPMYEEARAAAVGEIPAGPFAGVPFLLKDFLAEYAGVRFTEASAFLGDYVSTEDSELMRRFRGRGCSRWAKRTRRSWRWGRSPSRSGLGRRTTPGIRRGRRAAPAAARARRWRRGWCR